MMKNFLASVAVLLVLQVSSEAQTDERMRAILYLTGAESEEELDEQEVERFSGFLSRPLEINMASGSRLVSSGLLSRYQAASLLDYRSRSGDVLSVSELAAVDGFGEEFAHALGSFVSFRSRNLPGQTEGETKRLDHEELVRFSIKGGESCYGVKHRMEYAGRLDFSVAARTSYSDNKRFPPSAWSLSMAYYGRKRLGKVIAGDFNARFGQGLALWSGMSLSGLSSSLAKRPSGLSPSCSWSGSGTHRGVAADFTFGRTILSSFLSFPGLRPWCEKGKSPAISLMPGANVTHYSKNGQFSLTGYAVTGPMNISAKPLAGKLSGDFRLSWCGSDYFGEAAWDFAGRCPSVVLGTVIPLGKDWKISSVLHSYRFGYCSDFTGGIRSWTKTSDEHGVALVVEKGSTFLSADFALRDQDRARRQIRGLFKMPIQVSETSVISVRLTERYRPYEPVLRYRTGARCDCDWSSAGISARYGPADKPSWKARARIEGLLCRSLAGLAYLEGGRRTDRISAYLRSTIFIVDNWDDRIYSYERDAPGNFTVPAYYGRGWSVSAVCGWKLRFGERRRKALKLYFRASTVRYSFMSAPKPPVSEVKLQGVMTL